MEQPQRLKDGRPRPPWDCRIQRIKAVDSTVHVIQPQNGDFLRLLKNYRILVGIHKKLRKKYIRVKSKLIEFETPQDEEEETQEETGWDFDGRIEKLDDEALEVVQGFHKFI